MLFFEHRFNIVLELNLLYGFTSSSLFICWMNVINSYGYDIKISEKVFDEKLMEFLGKLKMLIEKLLVFAVNSSAFN